MEKFIERVTDVIATVTKCRLSGRVIVAILENKEIKEAIMKRKVRLGEKDVHRK